MVDDGAMDVRSTTTVAGAGAGDDVSKRVEGMGLDSGAAPEVVWGPLPRMAAAYCAGVLASPLLPWLVVWWCLAAVTGVMWLALRRHPRWRRALGLILVAAVAAGWALTRGQQVAGHHLIHHITPEPQLARVTGIIDSPVTVVSPQRGPFAGFAFESPSTTFTLDVRSIAVDGRDQPTVGRLLIKLRQADTRFHQGDEVELTGWMQAIDEPSNPGEFDYRRFAHERAIDGRITLAVRGNCTLLTPGSSLSHLGAFRQRIADACSQSLRKGMQNDAVRLAFLDTLLLGRWSRDLDELSDAFRRTGLTHILSISGAHLTILMLLVWLVVHLVVQHPSRAALVVLAVLLLYMLAVPWRPPIVRAGVMAGLVCLGAVGGRRVRAIDMIALSALVLFIAEPADLFNAGAQLSFGVVAGLLLFTRPVSHRLWPDPLFVAPMDQPRHQLLRRLADYVAMNLVAFLIAMPLVAFHFQWVSPLSMLLSLVSLPVITAVIGLGYLKILVGLIAPSLGAIMAGPLEWLADSMTSLVTHAAVWPGSSVALGSAPPVIWVVAALTLATAAMAGLFAHRRRWLGALTLFLLAWLALFHHPRTAALLDPLRHQPAMRIHMFAVGDGSCFLLRLPAAEGRPARNVMFDCGSLGFLDVGARSIVPALRSLNIVRIDALILSHADLDHFCGVIDLVNEIEVAQVLMPPQLLHEAETAGNSAAAWLVDHLRERRLPIDTIARGWSTQWGEAQADVLWPPADFESERANSSSLVLSVRAAGRRLMLSGDIDQVAIPKLLATGDDLKADLADLPHHGSFVRASPQWFKAVAPSVVLQSTGPARLRNDLWADLLADPQLTRLVTAKLGMVTIDVERDGEMKWKAHRRSAEMEQP